MKTHRPRRANFTLPEGMTNATGSYLDGNYNVTAVYLDQSNNANVNMTGDNDVVLALNLVIPEFSSPLFLTLFITLTLVAVLTYKRTISD